MHIRRRLLTVAFLLLFAAGAAAQPPAGGTPASPSSRYRMGHSTHGKAFDEGPRERPVRMDGIGQTHFAITTTNPEVQAWFDQGYTLLHSFWFYEAERAFRWCLKLEPGNAMAYWGLARASEDERARREFLKEALARQGQGDAARARVPRGLAHRARHAERRPDRGGVQAGARASRARLSRRHRSQGHARRADDGHRPHRDASCCCVRCSPSRPIIRPRITIAIHNWDGPDGAQALDSCRRYGAIAPRIGHALHMPGHVYAGLGMFHEAAISLDSATRAEIRYMGERLVFPYNTWNYAHNRNYLSYVQEQLGLVSEALRGARELLAVPLDPKLNDAERYSPHWQGIEALTRALVKFERWDEILDEGSDPVGRVAARQEPSRRSSRRWRTSAQDDRAAAAQSAQRARRAQERVRQARARLDEAASTRRRPPRSRASSRSRAATRSRGWPGSPTPPKASSSSATSTTTRPAIRTSATSRSAARISRRSSPSLARDAFEKALAAVPNDPFALAGLARAQRRARRSRRRPRMPTRGCCSSGRTPSRGPACSTTSSALGLTATADRSRRRARSATTVRPRSRPTDRQSGPPTRRPRSKRVDAGGRRVTLADFKGKNVLLVFYLGGTCVHCMKQLKDIAERKDEFDRLDTVLLAVSSDAPQVNKPAQTGFAFRLLSDARLENARRFKSYDDFEELPMHATVLIDRDGRIHWARHGGAPFGDVDFLVAQLRRMNDAHAAAKSVAVSSKSEVEVTAQTRGTWAAPVARPCLRAEPTLRLTREEGAAFSRASCLVPPAAEEAQQHQEQVHEVEVERQRADDAVRADPAVGQRQRHVAKALRVVGGEAR